VGLTHLPQWLVVKQADLWASLTSLVAFVATAIKLFLDGRNRWWPPEED
jgi:hypothetical protein